MESSPAAREDPLPGCYLLVVLSEPFSEDHKHKILQRVAKGLLSWDVAATGCDLSGVGNICTNLKNTEDQENELLIQYSTETLAVEVLMSPQVSTLKQCLKNVLLATTGHKIIIHAGYAFTGTGSWILQNGTFSVSDFADAFHDADVQKVLKGQPKCTVHVHCTEEGEWSSANVEKQTFNNLAHVSLNPPHKVDRLPGSDALFDCLDSVLNAPSLVDMMKTSPLVGNIRFNRPTLYVFPGGQGDCALFGISGFNMLIDGGFNRKPCSWEFIRHLDRLDAVLVTRLSESNLCGMSTMMKRKAANNTSPQIGYVFCNIAEGKWSPSEETQKDKDGLLISVVGEGHNFIQNLHSLKLKPHQCWRDNTMDPFVLYHKVGHGTLEMYVLSPPKDSKEMKEFLQEWSSRKEKFSCVKTGLKVANHEMAIPLSHAMSICALLIWKPADPKENITRILFPGSTPQARVLEGLEKLKSLDVIKHPTCTKASLTAALIGKTKGKVERPPSKAPLNRKNVPSPSLSASSVTSRNGDIHVTKKENKDLSTKPVIDRKTPARTVPKPPPSKPHPEPKEKKPPVREQKATPPPPIKKESKPALASKQPEKQTAMKKTKADMEVKSKGLKEVTNNKKVIESKTSARKSTESATRPKAPPARPAPKVDRTKPTPVPTKNSKAKAAAATTAAVAAAAAIVTAEKKMEKTDGEKLNKEQPVEKEEKVEKKMSHEDKAENKEVEEKKVEMIGKEEIEEKELNTVSKERVEQEEVEEFAMEVEEKAEKEEVEEKVGKEDMMEAIEKETDEKNEKETEEKVNKEDAEEKMEEEKRKSEEVKQTETETEEKEVEEKADIEQNYEENVEKVEIEQKIEAGEVHEYIEKDKIEPLYAMKEEEISKVVEEKIENTYENIAVTENTEKISDSQEVLQIKVDNDSLLAGVNSEITNLETEVAKTIEVAENENFEYLKPSDEEKKSSIDQDSISPLETPGDETECLQDVSAFEKVPDEMETSMYEPREDFEDQEEPTSPRCYTNEFTKQVAHEEVAVEKENFSVDAFPAVPRDVDSMLASATMEGSFCEGLMATSDFNANRNIDDSCADDSTDEDLKEEKYETETTKDDLSDLMPPGTSKIEKSVEQTLEQDAKPGEIEQHVEQKHEIEESYRAQAFETEESFGLQKHEIEESRELQKHESEELYNLQNHETDESNVLQMHETDESNVLQIHETDVSNILQKYETEESYGLQKQDFGESYEVQKHETVESYDLQKHETEESCDLQKHETEESHGVQKHETEDSFGVQKYEIEESYGLQKHEIEESYGLQKHEIEESYGLEKNEAEEHYLDSGRAVTPEVLSKSGTMSPLPSTEVLLPEDKDAMTSSVSIVYDDEKEVTAGEIDKELDIEDCTAFQSGEKLDSGKLSVLIPSRDTDDDDEDVMKSPTPHAVVEYEGQCEQEPGRNEQQEAPQDIAQEPVDDFIEDIRHNESNQQAESDLYSKTNREEDEMIRYPTPPGEQNFYERVGPAGEAQCDSAEMADPITQHFVTTPHRQGPEVIDDPLYEESEEERSESPVEEQPVYGSILKADFPEFVNISGGTTPSEPQSPKSPRSRGSGLLKEGMSACSEEEEQETDNDRNQQKQNVEESKVEELCISESATELSVQHQEYNREQVSFGSDISGNIPPSMDMSFTEQLPSSDDHPSLGYSSEPTEVVNSSLQNEENIPPSSDSFQVNSQSGSYSSVIPPFSETSAQNQCYRDDGYHDKDRTSSPDSEESLNGAEEKNGFQGDCIVSEHSQQAYLANLPENCAVPQNDSIDSQSFTNSEQSKDVVHCDPSNGYYSENHLQKDQETSSPMHVEDNIHANGINSTGEAYQTISDSGDQTCFSSSFKTELFSKEYSGNINGQDFKDTEPWNGCTPQDYNLGVTSKSGLSTLTPEEENAEYNYESISVNSTRNESKEVYNSRLQTTLPHEDLNDRGMSPLATYSPEEKDEYVIEHSKSLKLTETSPGYESELIEGMIPSKADGDGYASCDVKSLSPTVRRVSGGEDPYGVSSEEDDSSSLPDSVSPHAYTNKAYVQEDVHLYKHEMRLEQGPNDHSLHFSDNRTATTEIPEDVDNHTITRMTYSPGFPDIQGADSNYQFRLEDWGKPMGLPSPPPNPGDAHTAVKKGTSSSKGMPGVRTTKPSDKRPSLDSVKNGTRSPMASPSKSAAKSKSPAAAASVIPPVYVDLAYVPHHADPYYCNEDFFKRVRARYYVFSGTSPSKEVLNALLEAKKSWKEEMEVTIIPTYETDTLGYWMALNQDTLAEYMIDVAPSASRCTVNLQDHETSCAAYRLEF